MQTILEVQGLEKSFGALHALAGVDLVLSRRSVSMIIGPNGSGKTTLINVISGLYRPNRGIVRYEGREIQGQPPHEVYSAGLVRTFQVPLPFVKLTVLENLLTAARNHPGESFLKAVFRKAWIVEETNITDFAFDIMHRLNLQHLWNERSENLSGGQFKLLEIGRALMSLPTTILMDEPVSGVNPGLAHDLLQHILRLREGLGITFLLVEHRLDIALQYVDYVYAMDKGRIVSQGKPDIVIGDPRVVEAYLGG